MVYLSFGSQIYHQRDVFRRVIEATRGLGMQLVIAAQQLHGSSDLGALPDHILTCGCAPQLSVLPRANVFVTHGGANSVMEAIRLGVPLLVSPVCNDQFHQAHYIRRSGIGVVLDLHNRGRRVSDQARILSALYAYRSQARWFLGSQQQFITACKRRASRLGLNCWRAERFWKPPKTENVGYGSGEHPCLP